MLLMNKVIHIMEQTLDTDGCPDLKKNQRRNVFQNHIEMLRVAETLNVVIDGFRIDFGVGGIHGSLSNKIAKAN